MTAAKTVLISTLCLLSGCGGGGGDSSWSGPRNAEGFPEVQGVYTVTYSQTDVNCSDGTTTNSPGLSQDVTVTQNGDTLEFPGSPEGFTAGFVVTRDSNPTGPISSDGEFSATRAVEGITNQSITTAINYVFNGQFSPTGFSGNVEYTAVFTQLNATCTYRATFDATKIN